MATAVLTRIEPAAGRSPLALWHLLSLDAPCVAAIWTAFLSHQFRLGLSLAAPFALGLAVWLLYVGDRIHDGAREEAAEERHRFHQQHRKALMVAGAAGALLLAVLVARLPHGIRDGWLMLAVPLFLHLAAIHLLQVRRLPKEPLVAIFFACAITVPLMADRDVARNAIPLTVGAFGCMCWLNCIAIARWEESLDWADRSTAWLGRHFSPAAVFTVCLAAPLLLNRLTAAVGVAVMAAAACLLLLDRTGRDFTRTTRRALADAALLTPLAVWPVLAVLKIQ